MPTRDGDIREHDLLCENCGYELRGHSADALCPECGLRVAESLPEARGGSPFQITPSITSWAATCWRVLRHPRTTMRRVRVERSSAKRLLLVNLTLAGLLAAGPWVGVLIGDPARSASSLGPVLGRVVFALVFLAEVTMVSLVMLTLTWIEQRGIRFFAAKRGWRLTRDASWQVCAHASVGWILASGLALLGMASLYAILLVTHRAPTSTITLKPYVNYTINSSSVIYAIIIGSGFFVGLLVFECLVYLGVRSCRYANTATPATPHPTSVKPIAAGSATST